jgi:tRNA pseudouridine38-40 synthase
MIVAFDGSAYHGWQIQPNGPSIQAEVERALGVVLREPIRITGAGRTDSGVHALGQVASFRTERLVPLKAFTAGVSGLLPRDIAVVGAEEAPEGFDARRSARGKIYRYRIVNRSCRAPLERRFAWEIFRPLDEAAMQRAGDSLLGTHDFSAFRASDCEAMTTRREVRRLEVRREGELLSIEIEASAFLKHMVRNIVGTLVEVGLGKRPVGSVAEVLASGDRSRAGVTAPPQGLCLVKVFYDPWSSSSGC